MGKFIDPSAAVEELDLYGSLSVADLGSGSGAFSIPAAKKVPGGTVYAIDVQEGPLAVLRKRAREMRINNIHTLRADLEKPLGSTLKNESVERVILSNILFQTQNKEHIIGEAFRILKKGGKMLITEWDADKTGKLGPKVNDRIQKENIRKWCESNGAILEKEFSTSSHHYTALYRKPL